MSKTAWPTEATVAAPENVTVFAAFDWTLPPRRTYDD